MRRFFILQVSDKYGEPVEVSHVSIHSLPAAALVAHWLQTEDGYIVTIHKRGVPVREYRIDELGGRFGSN